MSEIHIMSLSNKPSQRVVLDPQDRLSGPRNRPRPGHGPPPQQSPIHNRGPSHGQSGPNRGPPQNERLIVVPVHPEDRIEIQVRKMILVINPKPNADQVIILEIKTKITLVVVIIIMVRKAVSDHLVTSRALVVDQDPADSLVV